MSGNTLRVRMYRHGLGDCFLLTFNRDTQPAHMLIDCGTWGATTTQVKMQDVVARIKEDSKIDGQSSIRVLLVTHEHFDHVSGFGNKDKTLFDGIAFERVWLAWTEDPKDDLARQLAKSTADVEAGLHSVSAFLDRNGADRGHDAAASVVRQTVAGSLQPFADAALPASFGLAQGVNDTMHFVRTGIAGNEDKTQYFSPGACMEDVFPGFRIYVLGPPRDLSKLKNMGARGSSDLYHLAAGINAAVLSSSEEYANGNLSPSDYEETEASMPFDPRFRTAIQKSNSKIVPAYFDSEPWRQIGLDWTYAASNLALQLESLTNNTSLAIAIERISDGRVLLFPGDAQLGSWISWHDSELSWEVKNIRGETQKVTAKDLLQRTVFYKVGHHGSHNATPNTYGLELMLRRDELTAFIPVDRAVAMRKGSGWEMPARELYKRLLEQCDGRVVRSDTGWAAPPDGSVKSVEQKYQNLADDNQWAHWQERQKASAGAGEVVVDPGRLFIDYFLD